MGQIYGHVNVYYQARYIPRSVRQTGSGDRGEQLDLRSPDFGRQVN